MSNIRVSAAISLPSGETLVAYDHHRLRIKILDTCKNTDFVRAHYTNIASTSHDGDSGIDLVFPEDVTIERYHTLLYGCGIAVEFIPAHSTIPGAYWLISRSSIYDTPIRMANCIGLMDAGYRGEVKFAMDCIHHPKSSRLVNWSENYVEEIFDYTIEKGKRLFQIVAPDTKPIKVELVDELSTTARGAQGFGSTN